MNNLAVSTVRATVSDLSRNDYERFVKAGTVACDIETTGLDWRESRIALCQFAANGISPVLVRVSDQRPVNICRLIENNDTEKVFHHAPFDLSFMSHEWGVTAQNVWCTKIAAKLLWPAQSDRSLYSLQSLMLRHLGVTLDKGERLSNWRAPAYSRAQIEYAANDVAHLIRLRDELDTLLTSAGLAEFAIAVFQHIPVRVALDTAGFGDVYSY
jgi:ribonuclease D